MAGAVGLFVGVSTGGCATISGNSRLTGLRSHFGHWLCSRQHGTDSGGVDLAPERAGCACSNLFACSMSEQTNKQLLYSERAEPSAVKGAPILFYHCVALVVVTIYTNIQMLVGWMFFGFEEVSDDGHINGGLPVWAPCFYGTHLCTMLASRSLCLSLYSVSTCS